MFLFKIIGKILLIQLWISIAIVWVIVKMMVGMYGVVEGILGFFLTLLILAVVICYRDWVQVVFLTTLSAILIAIFTAGVFVEMVLETVCKSIGQLIVR